MPNDQELSPVLSWLIPLLGGAATAYSPRYAGAGVQTFGQLYGNIQAQKQRQREAADEAEWRKKQYDAQLQHYQAVEGANATHNTIVQDQNAAGGEKNRTVADAYAAVVNEGATPPDQVGPPRPLTDKDRGMYEAIKSGGMSLQDAYKLAHPAPAAEPRPERPPTEPMPFAAYPGGGVFNRGTGEIKPGPSKPTGAPGTTDKPPTPDKASLAISRLRKEREYAEDDRIQEIDAELEYWRQFLPTRKTETSQTGAPPSGIRSEAGKRLAAKYGLQ